MAKKITWIYSLILFAVSVVCAPAYLPAMPPHPSIINTLRERGDNAGLARLGARAQAEARRRIQHRRASPIQGEYRVLVILVEYSDRVFRPVSTPTFYSRLLNGAAPGALSMKKYYADMSGGIFNISIDVVGPYKASGTAVHYGANDSEGNDLRPATLVREAVLKAQAAGVDFDPYDNDDDGYVDTVMVIHDGIGEEVSDRPNDIWSHAWELSSGQGHDDGDGPVAIGSKTVDVYCIQPEYTFSAGDSAIGVFCHEYAHILGLPDMYDTTDATAGAGDFTIMASGAWCGPDDDGSHPTPFLAWEKNMLGWLAYTTPTAALAALPAFKTSVVALSAIPVDRQASPVALFAGLLAAGGLAWFAPRTRHTAVLILVFAFLLGAMVWGANCGGSAPHNPGGTLSSDSGISSDSGVSVSSASSDSGVSVFSASSVSGSPVVPGFVTLGDIETTREAVKIPLGDPAGRQYYLLENKAVKSGTWTQYFPGNGLLITHIHDGVINAKIDFNTVNDGRNRIHGVNVVEADNNRRLWTNADYGTASDLFRSRSFTPGTTPATFYYNGTSSNNWSTNGTTLSKVYISNISAAGAVMTFEYKVQQ
ncbi:MAG: M6 family metalloprotease domain-containing protein [Spirochaetota bacterium]|nr:M6 family metalloprotease domain-containing protein [Spirochaetota bacterium]